MMSGKGRIQGIFGPVVKGWTDFPVFLYEVVRVGERGLLGEVIRIDGDVSDIQVYEDTEGLRVGEDIRFTGELLSVDLGPGLLGNVFDGIGRPLELISGNGCFIQRGSDAPNLAPDRKWPFTPLVGVGDLLGPGDVIGEVKEGPAMTNLVMAPPGTVQSSVDFIAPQGDYPVSDILCTTQGGLRAGLSQRWQVRRARPVAARIDLSEPLVTGQRIIDTLFPVALGGAAVVPGGFGTGKTVTQQSLAKWCNADVIIYIGCGERGNEMTEVLEEFPTLTDPSTGEPLMDRMILIANTSNMPVAAREASIYLGMTFGEYFRDMGKNVAIMADSTSRWAEALREIGGRLEEMPGEEGYPAYLGSRLSQYYERAGRAKPLGKPERNGSITVINAVSPPGGDFSEPVTQSSLRLSGAFWALDKALAQQRHFPSINWKQSYSLYVDNLAPYFEQRLGPQWSRYCDQLRILLDREKELQTLVQIVGRDGLSEKDKWLLRFSELLKVVYLQQNAFDDRDAYFLPESQLRLLSVFFKVDRVVAEGLARGLLLAQIDELPLLRYLLDLRAAGDEVMEERGEALVAKLGMEISGLEVILQ